MVICKEMTSSKELSEEAECSTSSVDRVNFRSHKGQISNVLVIEVNKENLNTIWPYLLICIRNASFISLDLELSGLGMGKGWLSKSLQERYDVVRRCAQSHAVLSVGISTFQLVNRKETDTKKRLKYKCQVFNLLTLCSEPFVVESNCLQFLSEHKFDFNGWISLGIPYSTKTEKENTMRTLWSEILYAAIPITVHNGLVDLAFIYQHFYSELPESFTEFVANVSDWFLLSGNMPGLYDSKHIAQNVTEFRASYLEYVFRKCQRENAIEHAASRLYVSIEFDYVLKEATFKKFIDIIDCKLPKHFDASAPEPCPISEEQKNSLCNRFSSYGLCRAKDCPHIHDVDILLSMEDQKQAKVRERRKRRYDYESKLAQSNSVDEHGDKASTSSSEGKLNDTNSDSISPKNLAQDETLSVTPAEAQKSNLRRSVTGSHRAGVDSFMTGFAVIFMQRMSILRTGKFDAQCGNHFVISGKLAPMKVHRSDYVASAGDHIAKWTEIERERKRRVQLEESTR